jgi:hypothetical protein
VKRLRSISIGRLACRSVALAMVGTVLTACGVVARYRQRADSGRTGTAAGHMAEVVMARQPEVFVRAAVVGGAAA